MPSILRSDRGRHFTAEVFEELCRMLGIDHKMGSPEHPESQGQVERQNQLVNQIRCLCENDPEKWPEALSKVQLSHNASENAGSRYTPSKMLLGKTIQLPDDLLCKQNTQSNLTPINERMEQEEDERLICIDSAKKNIANSQDKRNENMMNKTNGEPYQIGDQVRYKLNDDARGKIGGKIAPRYSEVYEVTEVLPNQFTYTVEPVAETSKGRAKRRHFNELKTVERVGCNDTPSRTNQMISVEDSVEPQANNVQPIIAESGQPRRSGRDRKQTKFLQVNATDKQYAAETVNAGSTSPP